MSWLAVLAFGRRVVTAVITWLSHASFWQLVSLGLGAWMILAQFQLADARHDANSYRKQRDEYRAQIDAADAKVRKSQDALNRISKELKDKNDAENRRIADDAGSLRVSGPGKAACRPASAASGGHEQAPAKSDASGPALPPDDRAAVPWGWLTDRAEEHDQLRAEVQSWRDWYAALVRNWPKNELREPSQ